MACRGKHPGCAVAGLLGYEELLKRVDGQKKRLNKLHGEVLEGFKGLNEALARLLCRMGDQVS